MNPLQYDPWSRRPRATVNVGKLLLSLAIVAGAIVILVKWACI